MEKGSKLSKHVLGMKFMKKTKDQIDRLRTEKLNREHFGSEIKINIEEETPQNIIEEVKSYSQCLGYNYGRVSFGGINPIVEYNVKKGNWRTEYDTRKIIEDDESDDNTQNNDQDMDKDVDDEEMGQVYGSIVATVGKKFINKTIRGKRERSSDEEGQCSDDEKDSEDDDVEDEKPIKEKFNQRGRGRGGGRGQGQKRKFDDEILQRFDNNKRKRFSYNNDNRRNNNNNNNNNRDNRNSNSRRDSFRGQGQQNRGRGWSRGKEKKFMKPSDD